LHHGCISIDVWGWGNVIPLEKSSLYECLSQKLRATTSQAISETKFPPELANSLLSENNDTTNQIRKRRSRRPSLPIAAKLDVFVSVDIEERGSDGLFKSTTVKVLIVLWLN